MPAENCSLATSVEELKRALEARAGRSEADAIGRVGRALAAVEQAARRHRVCLKEPEGRAVDVDTALNPSPVISRRVEELGRELNFLLQEAGRLRKKLQEIHPPATEVEPATAAGALPVAPEAADVADYGVFCERAERLLQGFEHFDEEESVLIQDSVNLDLGAGD